MTVAIVSNQVTYVGANNASIYPFTFPVFQSSDLVVSVVDTVGNGYSLVLGTDYTVVGLNAAGGAATTGYIQLVNAAQAWLTTGALTTGWTLTIKRTVPVTQASSIRNQGSYLPDVIENALDYLVMICQQLNTLITAQPVATTTVRLYRQTMTGALNGVNTVFTAPSSFIAGTEEVFLGGVLQDSGAGDYSVTAATQITFAVAPAATQAPLRISYNH